MLNHSNISTSTLTFYEKVQFLVSRETVCKTVKSAFKTLILFIFFREALVSKKEQETKEEKHIKL